MNSIDFGHQGFCAVIKVGELETRYGIVPSGVYARLKKLNIKPQRIGRHSYITDAELALVDRLHAHIKGGGTTAQFVSSSTLNQPVHPGEKGLDCFRALDEACQHDWLLGSSQLSLFLGVPATTIEGFDATFSDGGFIFCRKGTRLTGEAAWKISKI